MVQKHQESDSRPYLDFTGDGRVFKQGGRVEACRGRQEEARKPQTGF